jgi:biopolymer transport protein ExbD
MPDAAPRRAKARRQVEQATLEHALEERRAARVGPRRIVQPNLTPMIDVVFNLLIFFLCTGSFNQPEGLLPSRLPKHHGVAASDELPTTPIRVLLRQYGSGDQDYTIRIEQRAQRPNDFDELAQVLAGLRESPAFTSESQVIIVADGNVRWDHLVNAFNAALVARFKNISFGTK